MPRLANGNRRMFLQSAGGGFGWLALQAMLDRSLSAEQPTHPAVTRPPAAKSVIQIFCPGGMSHVDTWDYKPQLAARDGKPFDSSGKLQFFASKPGNCRGGFWPFRQQGQCGRWISDLFPQLAGHVDQMAFIYSMHSKTALHGPACFMMNTGFVLPGFPSMGAWVTYGLGSETDELPAFVVLPDPRGLPPGGPVNWGAGFLPARHQGTTMSTADSEAPIADLFPAESLSRPIDDADEKRSRRFLALLNHRHARQHGNDDQLEARIAAYELAARLQLSAPEATAIADESAAIHRLYHLEHPEIGAFGRQCLLARRLIERGVRFVQIFCGAENTTAKKIRPNWDSHEDLPRDHGYWGQVLDSGASALLTDLKQRGLLDSTLVMCTTEFGRQPAAQGKQAKGRDHNSGAFTAWLAGGGIKGGVSYGATDELGFEAVENPTFSYDLHATALHVLGIDHTKLTFYHNGIQRRLTDVHGSVIKEIVA